MVVINTNTPGHTKHDSYNAQRVFKNLCAYHTEKEGPWSLSIEKCPRLFFCPLYQKVCIGSRSWWLKWKLGQRSISALSAGPETLFINNLRLGQFDVSYWPWLFPGPPRNSPCIPTHQNLNHEVWYSAVKLYLQADRPYIACMGIFTAVIASGSWIDRL